MIIDDAKLQSYRIETLYAAIAIEGDNEGIVACFIPGLGATPMVFSDPAKLDIYKSQLRELVRITGKKIEMREYSLVESEPLQ